jgi:hypothetical protein
MYKLYNSLSHSHHLDNKYLIYILITSILALSSLFLLTIFNFLVSRDYNDIDIIFSPYKYVKTNYNNTINSISTNASGSSMSLYKLMNELGFERFRIQLIEIYPCEDIYQHRQREGFISDK